MNINIFKILKQKKSDNIALENKRCELYDLIFHTRRTILSDPRFVSGCYFKFRDSNGRQVWFRMDEREYGFRYSDHLYEDPFIYGSFITDILDVRYLSAPRVVMNSETTEKKVIDVLGKKAYRDYIDKFNDVLIEYNEEQKRFAEEQKRFAEEQKWVDDFIKRDGKKFINAFCDLLIRLSDGKKPAGYEGKKIRPKNYKGNKIKQITFDDLRGNKVVIQHWSSEGRSVEAWTDHLSEGDDGYVLVGVFSTFYIECQFEGSNGCKFKIDCNEISYPDEVKRYNLLVMLKRKVGEHFPVFRRLIGLQEIE